MNNTNQIIKAKVIETSQKVKTKKMGWRQVVKCETEAGTIAKLWGDVLNQDLQQLAQFEQIEIEPKGSSWKFVRSLLPESSKELKAQLEHLVHGVVPAPNGATDTVAIDMRTAKQKVIAETKTAAKYMKFCFDVIAEEMEIYDLSDEHLVKLALILFER